MGRDTGAAPRKWISALARPKSRNPPSDLIRDSMHLRMYSTGRTFICEPRSRLVTRYRTLKWIHALYRGVWWPDILRYYCVTDCESHRLFNTSRDLAFQWTADCVYTTTYMRGTSNSTFGHTMPRNIFISACVPKLFTGLLYIYIYASLSFPSMLTLDSALRVFRGTFCASASSTVNKFSTQPLLSFETYFKCNTLAMHKEE